MNAHKVLATVAATGLVSMASAMLLATAPAATAAPTHEPAQTPSDQALASPFHCRNVSSEVHGASASAELCYQKSTNALIVDKAKLTDSAPDGAYAEFRVRWRWHLLHSWHTKTKILKTTKGKTAPAVISGWTWVRTRSTRNTKDFAMQVCKQGSGHRTCDTHWH